MAQTKTKKFSKILIALDGSQPSIDAADYAIEIAKNDNSQLIALTVLNTATPRRLSSSFIAAPTYGLKELEEEKTKAQQWLDKIEKRSEGENNVQCKTEIVESSMPVEGTIVDYAERENVDLIVIGTRGRSGFKKMLLGSVASGVVTYAGCPVLVVK